MPENAQKRKKRAAALSVASNTVLIVMKITVGILIGSVSVISEAIHSSVDLLASAIALFSVSTSDKPADKEHPFGHGKIENISGTVEALLIFFAAAWIVCEAVQKLIHPRPIDAALLGVGVMFISAVANVALSHLLLTVGRETDSIALQADAWHLRTDVYTSAGVMSSLAVIWLGERVSPGFDLSWLDPVCAVAVALLITKAAYRLTIQSARDLLDVHLPPKEEACIRNLIEANRGVVHGYHYLRTRKAGRFRFVEFHIQVDPKMTVELSHKLAQKLTGEIKNRLPDTTVTVHIEPCLGDCNKKCLSGCLLTESERLRAFGHRGKSAQPAEAPKEREISKAIVP